MSKTLFPSLASLAPAVRLRPSLCNILHAALKYYQPLYHLIPSRKHIFLRVRDGRVVAIKDNCLLHPRKKGTIEEAQTAEIFVDQTIFLKLNPLQIIFIVSAKLKHPYHCL
jgi:hypothetical protein